MKMRFTTVALSVLIKPAVLVGLFAAVSRVAQMSGFGVEVIAPVASSLAERTGLSYNYAVVLVTGLIAYSFLRVLSAAWGVVAAQAPR